MAFIRESGFPGPSERVTLMVVDSRLEPDMKAELRKRGIELLEIPPAASLSPSVSGHPDMQLVHMGENIVVCQPEMPQSVVDYLKNKGFLVFKGKTILQNSYPGDIAYNVAITGKRAFHNTKFTDPVLRVFLERTGIRLIHVNQGYTRCAMLLLTPESIITADPSIASAAQKEGMDVLRIPPQRNICLKGLDHGFIGGAVGFIQDKVLAFAGNFDRLNSKERIEMFLKKHGVHWVSLEGEYIGDFGGFIPLMQG